MSDIKHINEEEFENVIKDNKMVVVDFFATWCPPCKMLGPVLEELQDQNKDVLFVKINVDENENLAKKFAIMNIPTLMFYLNGEVKEVTVGFRDAGNIQAIINKIKN